MTCSLFVLGHCLLIQIRISSHPNSFKMSLKSRIIHFLIDTVVFFLISVIFLVLNNNFFSTDLIKQILLGLYFVNYFLFEYFLGKTPGKYLTGFRVADVDSDHRPTFWQVLLRTLGRVIPLYFFSYFITGKGLHDHISNTYLIQNKK